MRLAALVLAFFASASWGTDVPFYVRQMGSEKDVSAVNENFRSIVGDATKLRADVDAVQTLHSTLAHLDLNQTFTGTNTFNGALYGIGHDTYTVILNQQGDTNTSWGGCNINGSTFSITTYNIGGTITATVSGPFMLDSITSLIEPALIMDGNFSYGTTLVGLAGQYDTDAGAATSHVDFPLTWTNFWVNQSSGTHRFCMGIHSNDGTHWYIEPSTLIWAKEVR